MVATLDHTFQLSAAAAGQLAAVEAGLPLTADICRADVSLCRLHDAGHALVVRHVAPNSVSSLYQGEATGRIYTAEAQPLLLRALYSGRGGQRQHEVVNSRAPILQDVYPIFDHEHRVIAALVVETNRFAYERHRRRNHIFQHAVQCLLQMCIAGELACTASLSRFGLYDGIYLADRKGYVTYISGIAANMFRSIGLPVELQGQRVAELESRDREIVDEVLATARCLEDLQEPPDGRVWVRKAIPLRMNAAAPPLHRPWLVWQTHVDRGKQPIDAVIVLLHNATEAVQKQRELNVKSAIIQEVHHRVKNNLQLVAAILRMQARRSAGEETRQHLGEAVNRILSVAVIHEFLSEDEHQPINIRDLAQRVAQQVQQVAGRPDQQIDIRVQGPMIRLPAGQATPVAMVLNELVLNAIEHGLSAYEEGAIEIGLFDLGDAVCMTVENTGSSLPPDFDPQHAKSLGLQIVHTLVTDDLKGTLSIERVSSERAPGQEGKGLGGTRAAVTFPKRSLRVD